MSLPLATVAEPLAVALHSMKFAAIRLGETAAVFGAGPIGLLTVACLRLAGAGRIWSVDPVAHRREMAQAGGRGRRHRPAQAGPVAEILRETGGRGVDVAIDCAAKGDTVNQCIHAARNAGRVVITGIPAEPRVALEFSPMRRKGTGALQRAPVQPRNGNGVGDAGRAHGAVRGPAHPYPAAGRNRRRFRYRRALRRWRG